MCYVFFFVKIWLSAAILSFVEKLFTQPEMKISANMQLSLLLSRSTICQRISLIQRALKTLCRMRLAAWIKNRFDYG
jgi:hypothetical protein